MTKLQWPRYSYTFMLFLLQPLSYCVIQKSYNTKKNIYHKKIMSTTQIFHKIRKFSKSPKGAQHCQEIVELLPPLWGFWHHGTMSPCSEHYSLCASSSSGLLHGWSLLTQPYLTLLLLAGVGWQLSPWLRLSQRPCLLILRFKVCQNNWISLALHRTDTHQGAVTQAAAPVGLYV